MDDGKRKRKQKDYDDDFYSYEIIDEPAEFYGTPAPPAQAPSAPAHPLHPHPQQHLHLHQHLPQRPPRNETAFVIGLLAGIFGIWGLAHIINHKPGTGLLWMFIGAPVVVGGMAVLSFATLGLAACFALPLHIFIVYLHAKSGATYRTVRR